MTTATATEVKKSDSPFSYAAAASGKAKTPRTGATTPNETGKPSDVKKDADASESLKPVVNGEASIAPKNEDPAPALTNGVNSDAKTDKPSHVETNGQEEDGQSVASGQEATRSTVSNDDGESKSAKEVGADGKSKFKAQNLVEAPPPKQNPWTMRREAFDRTKALQIDTKKPQPTMNGTSQDRNNQTFGGERRHNRQRSTLTENRPHPAAAGRRDAQGVSDKRANAESGKDGKPPVEETPRGYRPPRGVKAQQEDSTNRDNLPPLAPPSLTDTSSWPTPDDAQVTQDEEKREKREREDKEKPTPTSTRPTKDKWISMPVTPNIIYETPLPTRGGRAGRGGRADRGGRSAQPSTRPPGDADATTPTEPAALSNFDKTRNSQPVTESRGTQNFGADSRPRRSTNSTVPSADFNTPEASGKKDAVESTKKDNEPQPVNGVVKHEATPATTSTERKPGQSQDDGAFVGQGVLPPSVVRSKAEKPASGSFQSARDQTAPNRSYPTSFANKQENNDVNHSNHVSRDRPSGRGGYRGGRGDNSYGGSRFSGGNSIRHHSPPSQINTNPHRQSPQYPSSPSTPQTARGSYRGNSRSQGVQQSQQFNKYNVQNGFSQQPQAGYVQSPTYQQYPYYNTNRNGMNQPMQFQPDYEFTAAVQNVINQLTYYFSLDNMVKDTFLRSHMDSQGWIFLDVIAGFRKVKEMSKDNIHVVREACIQSPLVEFRGYHPDGRERLRSANNPTEWVLKYEERDESCQNDGPYWDPRYAHAHQFMNHAPYPMYMQPPNMPPMPVPGPTEQQFTGYNGYPQQAQFMPTFVPGQEFVPENGVAYGNGFVPYQPFVPGHEVKSGSGPSLDETVPPNEHKAARSHKKYPTVDEFSDENVNQLVLVLRQNPTSGPDTEGERAGSTVKVTDQLNEALIKLEKNTEVVTENQKSKETDELVKFYPTSPRLGPTPAPDTTSDEVGWFVDPGASEENSRAPSVTTFRLYSYLEFKNRVLSRREEQGAANVSELDILYRFYSHFLRKHFNLNMYNEFKSLALEDFHNNSTSGIKYLYKFHVFKIHDFPTPDLIFQDFASLASEQNEKPPYDKKMVDNVGYSKSITGSTKTRLGKFMQEKNKNFQMWPVHDRHHHHHDHRNHHGGHHNNHGHHSHSHSHQNANHVPNGPAIRT